MFPSDHIPIFRPLASSSRDGSGSWSEQKCWAQTRLVFVYMCVCFGRTHKMSSGTSVRHAYNSAIRLHALWSECLCECVWLCLGLHMDIFTQMSWHNCGKFVCRSESTDLCWAKRCLLQVLPRPPKRTTGGWGRSLLPPSLQEEPDREWEDCWKTLYTPLLVLGKALNTLCPEQNIPAVIPLSGSFTLSDSVGASSQREIKVSD